MKKLTVAMLILFATSLFGAAFASNCMAAPRADSMSAQEQMPSCCDLKVACAGGSCFAVVHNAGCSADHGASALGQKSQAASDLAPAPAIVPSPWFVPLARDDEARPPPRIAASLVIAGYADIYARTGRLLI